MNLGSELVQQESLRTELGGKDSPHPHNTRTEILPCWRGQSLGSLGVRELAVMLHRQSLLELCLHEFAESRFSRVFCSFVWNRLLILLDALFIPSNK